MDTESDKAQDHIQTYQEKFEWEKDEDIDSDTDILFIFTEQFSFISLFSKKERRAN